MSNPKLKELAQLIKKMAGPNDDDLSGVWGGGGKPTGGQPTGGRGGGGGYAPGNPAVKQMQQAMINLADTVMRDAGSQGLFKRPGDDVYQQADPETVQYRKAFNDFIAEQYAGSVPDEYKGVEWSQDTSVQSRPDKQAGQTDLYELNAVLNTMRRIGSPGPGEREFKAD